MRFGCCVSPDLASAAARAGYDFVELPVAVVAPERPEAEFAVVRRALLAGPLRPEAWRLFLPADLKVSGPNVDWARLSRYVYTALRRVAEVGGAVVCFGSGASRQVPAGFPVSEAREQLAEALRVCGMVAHSLGLVIAIEPLSPRHCNIINSVPEAVALARSVNMPEVGVLPDAYHMARDDQCPFDVVDAAQWLAHVHVPDVSAAEPVGRQWIEDFVEALRLADYDWRVSVECEWSQPEVQLGIALLSLRRCFEETLDCVRGGRG